MDDSRGVYSLDDVLGNFPDSREAVALIGAALRIGGTPLAADASDGREEAIAELFRNVSPAVRSRAVVLAGVFSEIANTVRDIGIVSKVEAEDPDMHAGEAEVTEDGWLVVSVSGKEIARVPFDPRRTDGFEQKLTADILAEHFRLHVRGQLEIDTVKKGFPAPGRRTVVAVLPEKPDAPAAE